MNVEVENILDQLYEADKAGIDQQEVFIELIHSMRTLRKERGLSQEVVGERMGGLSKARVSQIESINPVPNLQLQTLADYAEAIEGFVSIVVYKRNSYPTIMQERARRAQYDAGGTTYDVEFVSEDDELALEFEDYVTADPQSAQG